MTVWQRTESLRYWIGIAAVLGVISACGTDAGTEDESHCDSHGNRVYTDSNGSTVGVVPDEECAGTN